MLEESRDYIQSNTMNNRTLNNSMRSDILYMDQAEEAGASDFDYAKEFESDYGK